MTRPGLKLSREAAEVNPCHVLFLSDYLTKYKVQTTSPPTWLDYKTFSLPAAQLQRETVLQDQSEVQIL